MDLEQFVLKIKMFLNKNVLLELGKEPSYNLTSEEKQELLDYVDRF